MIPLLSSSLIYDWCQFRCIIASLFVSRFPFPCHGRLEYELELKVQHAARGTADLIASRIPPGQGFFGKLEEELMT